MQKIGSKKYLLYSYPSQLRVLYRTSYILFVCKWHIISATQATLQVKYPHDKFVNLR